MSDQTLTLRIEGMNCASCAGRVERVCGGIDGVTSAAVNLADDSVAIKARSAVSLTTSADALEATGYPPRTEQIRLKVSSMTSAGCVGRVERAISAVSGILSVEANLATEAVTVTRLVGAASDQAILEASKEAGQAAEIVAGGDQARSGERRADETRWLKRDAISAIAQTLLCAFW